MKKINIFFDKHFPLILIIFLFIQPILDLITSMEINVLHVGTSIGSITRLLFLGLSIYYLIFIDKNKHKIKLSLLFIYLVLFSITTIYSKDFNIFPTEFKNVLNTLYIIPVLLMLVDLFKEKKINFDLNKLIIIYLTYIILVFIPNITNTGYLSYYHSKVGTVGWFLSANAIGNILCILTPFMILFLLKSKINIIFKLLITLATCYVFVSMGTKVPVLGLGISVMVNTIYFMIKWIKEKKYKLFISLASAGVVAIIAAIIVIPKTSFYENIQIHKKFLGFEHYSEIFTDYKLVDHFIFSQRLTFLKNTHNNYLKTNIYEKTFGMGFIENYATDNVSDKTIEIDYFEVFYRNGIIGCILYFIILIPFIVKYFKTKYEGIESVEFKLSMVLILLLALFSGHVLVTPAVSIYVALIIAIYINKDSYKYFIKEKKETSK